MTTCGDIGRDGLRNRRWLLRRAAPAVAFLLGSSQMRSAEPAGAVEDVRGEAFAEADAVRRALARAAPVFLGDEVGTGAESRLGMRLGRDTTIRLGEKAHLKIDRFLVAAGGDVTLQSGPMLFDGPPGSTPARVQVRSPFGLIAVRGTRFFAGPSNGVFGVFVARGTVTVAAAGEIVVLHEGDGTDIARAGARPSAVTQWQPPRVRAALASVD